jgi:hypothetical protein
VGVRRNVEAKPQRQPMELDLDPLGVARTNRHAVDQRLRRGSARRATLGVEMLLFQWQRAKVMARQRAIASKNRQIATFLIDVGGM